MENLKLISEIQIKLKLNDIWFKVHSLQFDQSPENINKILKLTDNLIEQLRTNIYIKELQSENK